MVTKFSAGWNLPGCLPEMEPVLFDTEEQAQAFIKEEQAIAAEVYSGATDDPHADDPYVYWIEMVHLTEEEVAAYEADLL